MTAPGDPSGALLWTPSPERRDGSRMAQYLRWLEQERNVSLPAESAGATERYQAAWQYSVEHLEDFWSGLWDYFELGPRTFSSVLERRVMPGARWFAGAEPGTA